MIFELTKAWENIEDGSSKPVVLKRWSPSKISRRLF